jgi:site-specific DNA-methyltransferase (adenine-specific)
VVAAGHGQGLPPPYFERDGIRLFLGDCREVLPGLAAARVIGDPPYGTGRYATDTAVPVATFAALVRGHPTVAVFGYPEALAGLCAALGAAPTEWVTWWPTNAACKGGLRGPGLPREQEAIAVFGAVPGGRRLTRPRAPGSGTTRRIHAARGDSLAHARLGDVWRDASPGIGFHARLRRHPNEKPVALVQRLVELCSDPGDTVLDPWAGSGTTLVAARALGRRAIGIEIDARYCEIAAERLRQLVLPLEVAQW